MTNLISDSRMTTLASDPRLPKGTWVVHESDGSFTLKEKFGLGGYLHTGLEATDEQAAVEEALRLIK